MEDSFFAFLLDVSIFTENLSTVRPKELRLCTHPSRKIPVKASVQIVQCAKIFGRTGIGGVYIGRFS